MKKNWIVFCSMVSIALLTAVFTVSAEKSDDSPFLSKHIVFTEEYLAEVPYSISVGEEPLKSETELIFSKYEVKINELGHYRFEVIEGPFEGDYEIWDGNKLYQYSSITKDVISRDIDPDVVPIPHLFLSTEIINRVKAHEKNGKLTGGSEKQSLLSETVKVLSETDENSTTKLYFSESQNIVLKSEFIVDNEVVRDLTMEKFENIKSFESDLLSLPEKINIVSF